MQTSHNLSPNQRTLRMMKEQENQQTAIYGEKLFALYVDKTDFYLQFMLNHMTWSVYLGSVYDNPEGIEISGEFMCGDVTLYKGCVFDFLTIQWENIGLSQHDLDLHFPSSLPISLTSKFSIRKVFRNPLTLFRIIAHSPNNGKVRPLTSL